MNQFTKKTLSVLQRIDRWLAEPHPSITDIGKYRQARLLAYLSLIYMLTSIAGLLASTASTGIQLVTFALFGLFLITIITYTFSRTRLYLVGAVILICAQSLSGIVFLITNTSGTFTGILSSIIPSLLLATVYLPINWVILLTIFDILGIGFISQVNPLMKVGYAVEIGGAFFTVGVLSMVIMVFRNGVENERIRQMREINQELEETKIRLEDRVRERTTELDQRSQELEAANNKTARRAAQFEAIAQVAQAIASPQNLTSVFSSIADSISKQFGYYHVGVFLVEETGKYAVLAASNSTGGQNMLARGHRLEVGKVGIVGYAAGMGEARIALDTGKDAVFFNNPDLPRTHSEMALPLRSGKRTIGVLDVQSTEANAFGNEDIETLGILADQVSLAIDNSRLFEQTQRALAESELLNRQYLRQEWERMPQEQNLAGYRYNITGAMPLKTPMEIADLHHMLNKGELLQTPGGNGQPARLTIPVQIRGETIGILNIQSPEVTKWHPDQIEIARAVAERVALSIENARLFEETSQRAERERTVSRITTSIRSTNDPQTMLQTALEELKQALGATDINIRPYTPPIQPAARIAPRENKSPKRSAN